MADDDGKAAAKAPQVWRLELEGGEIVPAYVTDDSEPGIACFRARGDGWFGDVAADTARGAAAKVAAGSDRRPDGDGIGLPLEAVLAPGQLPRAALEAELARVTAERDRLQRACDSIRRSARALARRDDDALDAVTVDAQRRAMALRGMHFAGVDMYNRLPADPSFQRESDLPPRVPVIEKWDLGAPPSVRLWVGDIDTATWRYMKMAWAEEVATLVKASPAEVLAEALRLALEPEVGSAAGVPWRAGAGRPHPPTDAELAAHHGRWRCVVPGDVQRNCDAMRPAVARLHRETLAACGVRGALWWALDGDDAVSDWPRVDR